MNNRKLYLKPEWKEFVMKQHKGYFPILEGEIRIVQLFNANNTWREYAEVEQGHHFADIPCRFITSFNYSKGQS